VQSVLTSHPEQLISFAFSSIDGMLVWWSGMRCRLAYSPADASFLMPASASHSKAEKWETDRDVLEPVCTK